VELELAGPFALAHREVLQPAFPGARWVEASAPCWLTGAP
jgi:hypothetical protein